MAAVTVVRPRPVSPPGYEFNDRAQAAADIDVGELVSITSATPGNGYEYVVDLAAADAEPQAIDGIALMDAKAGQLVSIGIIGEMDGFSGMTRGARLYPSATVPGGIDTTATTNLNANMKAVTASRIRYNFS